MDDVELLTKLRSAFKLEADERLTAISTQLLELERSAEPEQSRSIVEIVFREAHSLKGASRAVNLTDVEAVCQSMENILGALKRDELTLSSEIFDTLHEAVRLVESILGEPEDQQNGTRTDETLALIASLDAINEKGVDSPGTDGNDRAAVERSAAEPNSGPSDVAGAETSGFQPDSAGEPRGDDHQYVPPAPAGTKCEASVDRSEPTLQPAKAENLTTETTTASDEPEEAAAGAPVAVAAPPKAAPRAARGTANTPVKPLSSGTVRISTEKLDALLLKAEEMVSLKLAAAQQLMNLRGVSRSLDRWKKKHCRIGSDLRSLRTWIQKQEQHNRRSEQSTALSNLLEFFDENLDNIKIWEREVRKLTSDTEKNQHVLGRMVGDLLDDMKKVTMLPFSMLLQAFPRMVRDISRDQGKDVDLMIQGAEIEIDRRILEEIKDPLIHLLRNSIDHGLERPEERQNKNKLRRGTINLIVHQTEGDTVEVLIRDDGRGIDITGLKRKAVEKGLLSQQDADHLEEQEAVALIFRSGMSTSPVITEISGRGLGMAIVHEAIENLNGLITVQTNPDLGTTFRILLPVTRATFRGILVRVGSELFIVPSSNVDRVLKTGKQNLRTVENKATVSINGKTLPFVKLSHVLGIADDPDSEARSEGLTITVIGTVDNKIAFQVDEVICEQEVLVKSLGSQLRRIRNVSGATVMGSGRVVAILNIHDLLKSAVKSYRQGDVSILGGSTELERQRSILVVDDSITSRMLLKNILETADYKVTTAVDGQDGFSSLETEEFDLVVSDVEMPRMSGFELTARIRGDDRLGKLPIVLVTSLASPEDQAQGIQVGANAYIVKSRFDQSNLLDVIKRLI